MNFLNLSFLLVLFYCSFVPKQGISEKSKSFRISDLVLSKTWVKESPPNATSGAAYLSIENLGAIDDTLTKASGPVANFVMIHENKIPP